MSQEKTWKRKTFPLKLTKFELIHLRDLFSITLPIELKQTVSQALAEAEGRPLVETRLWQKLVTAFEEAELPVNDDAPDFVVAALPAAAPSISVFRMAHEPQESGGEGSADTTINAVNAATTLFARDEEE